MLQLDTRIQQENEGCTMRRKEIKVLSSEFPCEIEMTLQKEQSLLCTLVSLDDKISPITI
jgi:hypothetical protein